MTFFSHFENFLDDLTDRFRSDLEVNRREDRAVEVEDERNEGTNEVDSADTEPKVVSVDFQGKANAVNHRCDKYEIVERQQSAIILRRGGSFTIEVEFNQALELKKTHLVKLYFSFGKRPTSAKGTQAILQATGKKLFDKNHEEWDVRVDGQNGKKITFEVQIPTDAPVGIWNPAIEVSRRNAPSTARHVHRSDMHIYILFNPWNKHDETYMSDDEKREEYVLADVGKIWVGNYPFPHGRPWVFGQFDDAVLPASVLLLERSGIPSESRGDPIRVSRAISKMVNSNDDSGVIVGRWDGKYEDGKSPSSWSGSIKILEAYIKSKRPVRYGQCWVFAGVVNTVCRALGLPSRVVSNFASAHDTNVSLTIDEYVDEKGNEIDSSYTGATPGGLYDSIWNFHVWNDVWMRRPDLPEGFGGWQVIDATPQETSDGTYQCGPASHEAIRRGQMEYKYDVPFVLAEVNADVVHWQKDDKAKDGFKKLTTNKRSVGRQLLTKKPGPVDNSGYSGTDKEDITLEYKPKEGTTAERVTLLTAARRTRAARHAFRLMSQEVDDVEFTLEDLERVPIGEGFTVTLTAKNMSEAKRTISVVMTCSSMYYTGAPAFPIKRREGEIVLGVGETKNMTMEVTHGDYYEKLVEHAFVRNVAICTVSETSYAWVGDDGLEIQKPDVKIEILSEAVSGKPLPIRVSFTNPLPITLRNCELEVDGPGVLRPKTIKISNVGPNEEMVHEMKVFPKKPKHCTLVVTFNSSQLYNLTGSKQVTINPPE
ncbi:hemocyte protein-glutamine gamma-glutamyltransferase-like [Penaeus japonicus]|uniref:hemocyte protein-glutamine gamma-glutamyltransferase-like n=1 Tax=Penaeus japonicus TaxID=27405 RepID=UPI001C71380F|nr:hemocyte protein-glutamine gamma-glutamyltransferase-like [Penaeus japonicus]